MESNPLMDFVYSIHEVPIRLTRERWQHIVDNHLELGGYRHDVLGVVESPDLILLGHGGTKIAVRAYGRNRYLMVVYREISRIDGFVITAFFSSRIDRKKALWKQT